MTSSENDISSGTGTRFLPSRQKPPSPPLAHSEPKSDDFSFMNKRRGVFDSRSSHPDADEIPYSALNLADENTANRLNSISHTPFREVIRSMPRKRHFVAVEITKGHCERFLLQTSELLKRVYRHQPQQRDCQPAGSVKMRDLRQLCSQSLGSQRASIEVRRNCILFNLVRARAVIMHQKVILLPQDESCVSSPWIVPRSKWTNSTGYQLLEDIEARTPSVDPFTEKLEDTLIKKLKRVAEEPLTSGPFEFVVLETLLLAICSAFAIELDPILREADRIMGVGVGRLSSAHRLHEVSDLQRQVGSLNDRLRGVSDAIQEILNNELDLRRLELSRFWQNPEEWEHPSDSSLSEDVEMLLECYEQEVGSMLKQTSRIDELLDDTLQMIQLHLASIRNTFLKSELGLDVVGTIVTFVAAVASIFGMNIPYVVAHLNVETHCKRKVHSVKPRSLCIPAQKRAGRGPFRILAYGVYHDGDLRNYWRFNSCFISSR